MCKRKWRCLSHFAPSLSDEKKTDGVNGMEGERDVSEDDKKMQNIFALSSFIEGDLMNSIIRPVTL